VYLCNFLNENIFWVENHGQKCKFKMADSWLGVVTGETQKCHNSRKVMNKTQKFSSLSRPKNTYNWYKSEEILRLRVSWSR